jgi:hypothetical protein
MDVGHIRLLSGLSLASFTKSIKIELMIGHLIACGRCYLHRPIRDVTKVQFDHASAHLTDDMVMVILQLAKFILSLRAIDHFEDDPQGLKKIEGPVDGSEPDPFLSPDQRLEKFLRAQGGYRIGKFLINQKPWMAQF